MWQPTAFPGKLERLERTIHSFNEKREHRQVDFAKQIRKKIERQIRQEADRHSVEMEIGGTQNGSTHQRRATKEALNRLNDSWNLICNTLQRQDVLEIKDYVQASGKLTPEARYDPTTRLRDTVVAIKDATYAPPPPKPDPHQPIRGIYDVPIGPQMEHMVESSRLIESDLERAIYTHFHLARIHPFSDGNGRIARLAQNAMLRKAKLLPVVIPREEKDLYASIIDTSVVRFNEGDRHYIKSFGQYIANKLENSFERYKHPLNLHTR